MSEAADNLDELRAALRADAAGVAEALLGVPSKKRNTKRTLRWGSKGSLSLTITGKNKGLWFSHEDGKGGDLLGLICRVHGCSFQDALQWASNRTGVPIKEAATGNDDDQSRQRRAQQEVDRRARQAQQDAQDAAEADSQQVQQIRAAQAIAAATMPLKGSLGTYYLKQVRGIPEPACGWPDSIRFHPRHRALVAIATAADGTVQAVQRVHLAEDGAKVGQEELERRRLPAIKTTNGFLKGAAVRLPGDPAGPLLLGEGPETALSLWTSTNYEVWAALGGIANLVPPVGRQIVVCRDDDRRPSPADSALGRTLLEWRRAGITVAVATPWAVQRQDGSDFADLILAHGVEAVHDRITAALRVPRLRPFYDAPTEPRDEALARQRALIRDTIATGAVGGAVRRKIARLREEAAAADLDFDQRPPGEKAAMTRRITRMVLAEHGFARLPRPSRILITGSQGSGKTHTSLDAVAHVPATLEAIAKLPADLVVRITQPSHDKAGEVLADYKALATADSLPALLVRGRSSFDPASADDERMCLRHDIAARAARKGVPVRKAICASCPFSTSCGYMRQEAQIKAMGGRGVFIAARAYNFLPCPAPTADILIADESITLEAIDDVLSEAPGILNSPVPFEGSNLASVMTANQIMAQLADVLTSPKPLAKLRSDGPTRDEMSFAKDMLERAINARQAAAIDGSMSDAEIHAVLDNHQANLAGSALVILNAVLRELDQPRDVFNGVEYVPDAWVKVDGREERQPRLRVHRLRQLHGITKDTTVFLLDGTGSERLNRALIPNLVHHRISIERDAHVTGTIGRNYSRQSCTGEDRNGAPIPNKTEAALRLRQEVKQIAGRLPGDTLIIASLKAADKLRAEEVVPSEMIAHFGKVRGRNQWEGCESALCLGAETVSVEAIETLARPFMVNDPLPFISSSGPVDEDWSYKTWPFKATRGRRMRDGTVQPVEVEVHPDPRVQEVLEQVREADVLQGGDRTRPIFNHRTLVFANSLVLDLTYDRIVTHKELVAGGSRLELVFRDLGVLPLGSRDLHAAYPAPRYAAGFTSKSAADDCLKQATLSGGVSQIESYLRNPPTYSYRRQGQAGSASRALIDTCRHPNPRLALEASLGPLAGDPVPVSSNLPDQDPPMPEPSPAAPALVYDVPWLHPEVPAHLGADGGIVLLSCPFCGQRHRHRGFGHRLAHCDEPSGRGYVLLDVGPPHYGSYGAAAGAAGAAGPAP